jgi:hypothetical protein
LSRPQTEVSSYFMWLSVLKNLRSGENVSICSSNHFFDTFSFYLSKHAIGVPAVCRH